MSNVLLVIDMVAGFLEPGYNLYCGDESRKIIPAVRRLIEDQQEQGVQIIFVCDSHKPDDLEFEMFPVHCVEGTVEAKIIRELSQYKGMVIHKTRYSAFYNTNLAQLLEENTPDKITICGVCTDICVMHTTADARNRDYFVEIPTNCVATFNPKAHSYALDHMEKVLGAKLIQGPYQA